MTSEFYHAEFSTSEHTTFVNNIIALQQAYIKNEGDRNDEWFLALMSEMFGGWYEENKLKLAEQLQLQLDLLLNAYLRALGFQENDVVVPKNDLMSQIAALFIK